MINDNFWEIPTPPLPQGNLRIPLFAGPSLIPREITTVIGISALGSDEKPERKEKALPKPSLLYILTGLGRYSWYKLPFLKGTICVSLPSLIMSYISRVLHCEKGSCKCRKASCKYIKVFGLCVGFCKEARKRRWRKAVIPSRKEG